MPTTVPPTSAHPTSGTEHSDHRADHQAKIDPFHPSQPSIPGVPNRDGASGATAKIAGAAGIAVVLICVAIAGGGLLIGKYKHPAKIVATPGDGSSADSASAPSAVHPAPSIPFGPGPVATKEEIAKAWASKRFVFHDAGTMRDIPALVIHLPGGQYWGISLREPYGDCEMEYVTSPDILKAQYGVIASHPMIGDPCNRAVFDLLKYGSGPAGLVRGEIVQGPALRPPVAIQIRADGSELVAVRME